MSQPINGANPTLAPNVNPVNNTGDKNKTQEFKPEDVKPEPSTADTAGKANGALAEGYFATFTNGVASAWNSTTSTLGGWVDSATTGASNFVSSTKEGIQNIAGNFTSSVQNGIESFSYNSLKGSAQNAHNYAYETVTGGWQSFTSTRAITWLSETADSTAQTVSDNAPAAANWLPVAVFGASAFAAVKSLKAAHQNYEAGNLKRAASQIVVGAAALALAGGIAYGSPIGQGAVNTVTGLFSSSEEPKAN